MILRAYRYAKRLLKGAAAETVAGGATGYVRDRLSKSTFQYGDGRYKIKRDGSGYELVQYPEDGSSRTVYSSDSRKEVREYVDGILSDLS